MIGRKAIAQCMAPCAKMIREGDRYFVRDGLTACSHECAAELDAWHARVFGCRP